MKNEAVMSWSGGKDSCLALYRAMNKGIKIKALVNMASNITNRCCFHGIENALMKLQAECMGMELIQHLMSPDMEMYEKEFKAAVASITGIDSMIFGDIYLDEHKDWVERVCRDINIKAVEPIWNEPVESLYMEFVNAGFKSVIVSCQASKLGREFIGRTLDAALMQELKSAGVCVCGENGEYHTLVVDGPLFKKRIEILEGEPILKDGFWQHWFYDIKNYRSAVKTK